jgi:phosphoglycolate phosphatase
MLAVDAIFFDVDGTLVDARRDIVSAMNYALRQVGLPEKSFDEIVSYIGTGVKDLISKSLYSADEGLIKKCVDIYGVYYMDHPADEAVLYPNVIEILEYFKEKRKVVLTNRYARFADSVLKALGIRSYFEEIIGGDDESCIKPCAGVLDPYISKSGIVKARSLIVGDMAIDIETGEKSGIKTCWVTYGLGKDEDVRRLKPDFIINNMIELKGIIAIC